MAIWILAPDPNGTCCGCEGRMSPCDTCGAGGITCVFALPLEPGSAPSEYPSYAAAESAMVGWTQCYAYMYHTISPVFPISLMSSVPSTDTLAMTLTTRVALVAGDHLVCSAITIGTDDLDLSFTVTTIGTNPQAYITILDDTTRAILVQEYISGTSGSKTYSLGEGSYVLMCGAVADSGTFTQIASTFTWTSTPLVANPLVGLYDDSGTQRQLEECPKLYLPPLTESTGDWYSSESAAQDIIDNQTSNCVGFADTPIPDVFTATDGGSKLTLNGQRSTNAIYAIVEMYGSVNTLTAQSIVCTYSATETGPATYSAQAVLIFVIYDQDGVEIYLESTTFLGSTSGSFTFTPTTYSGRYTVQCVCLSRSNPDPLIKTIDATFEITSSSTLSVNDIQALYNTGLDCPARLDCV